MNPSDSISSFGGPGFEILILDDGEAGAAAGGAKLPEDVIDALNEDNLELAMFLMDRHREEEGLPLASSRRSRSNKIRRFLSQIGLSGGKKAAPKPTSSRARESQSKKISAATQLVVVVKMAAAVTGRVVVQVVKIPVHIVQATMAATQKVMSQAYKFIDNRFFKPIVTAVTRPVIQAAEKIVERVKVFQQFIGVRYDKIVEKGREIQEKIIQTVEKVAHEVRELAQPVRLWLENRFEKFLTTQKWVNTIVGQEIAKIGEQSIQIVAYALVPVTFTIKQIKKGYKKAAERIKNGTMGAFSKAKNWINGKLTKAMKLFSQTFQTFKGAVERLALQWLKWILRMLKVCMRIAITTVKKVYKMLVAITKSTAFAFGRLAQYAFQVLRR